MTKKIISDCITCIPIKFQVKDLIEEHGLHCPTCGEDITNYSTGKVFCSRKCRFNKVNYPTIEQLLEAYSNIMSWEKVAKHFGVTRRVV